MDEVKEEAVSKAENSGIIFIDEIDDFVRAREIEKLTSPPSEGEECSSFTAKSYGFQESLLNERLNTLTMLSEISLLNEKQK